MPAPAVDSPPVDSPFTADLPVIRPGSPEFAALAGKLAEVV